ncbi:MAG: hypothetical protein HZA78_04595 [Candidatus Schekmanbacteria bacterium]|nr:hypothetical protein [Candidatus Schekmanbacteria bacterium]
MLRKVYLYNETPAIDLDVIYICRYLSAQCPVLEIILRESFIARFYSPDLIKSLAGIWSDELLSPGYKVLSEEERLEYEAIGYRQTEKLSPQVIYHGWPLWELLKAQIPQKEASLNALHLILTPRLAVTREPDEKRFHARTVLLGQPSIISSSGLVEAPARPQEYYFWQAGYRSLGLEIPEAVIREKFADQFLTYHDSRLSEVALGYILQTIAYYFYGEAFCQDPSCRLFNAHYQKAMLAAQLTFPEFCPRHSTLFSS